MTIFLSYNWADDYRKVGKEITSLPTFVSKGLFSFEFQSGLSAEEEEEEEGEEEEEEGEEEAT